MKKLILLIDDDKLPMKFYVKALESCGFEVERCYDPDGAIDFAKKNKDRIKVIILDIMMPPGELYKSKDIRDGLRTGNFLYDSIKTICPNAHIIVLTNVNQDDTLHKFYDLGVEVKQKISCPPFELAELVSKILSE